MYETVIVHEATSHYEIVLNRPEKLNALSEQMVMELHRALSDLKTKQPKILLLKGAGTSFCSGHDLSEPAAHTSEIAMHDFLQTLQELTMMLVTFRAPVITAIQGYALGAGLEIALNTDLIYVADNAEFRFPELEVGLSITQGSSYFLPRMTSSQQAKELLFFGSKITAEQAKELGFVNDIFKREQLFKEVDHIITTLNKRSISSLSSIKKLLHKGANTSLEKSLQNEIDTLIQLLNK